jgi:two-component system cell cycle response regulator DivK
VGKDANGAGGELILVVDDHELNVKLLRVLLERRGHRVHAAGNAREARASVRAHKPSLILMDIQLPNTNGIELTQEFKADPDLRDIPIIAVTSRAMIGDEQAILAAGCDAYVSKPIEKNTLLALVARYLHLGRA